MKYELVKTDTKKIGKRTLYRIRALVDIGAEVVAGDLGGYVESEKNLSQGGTAWVYDDACVYANAWVCGNAGIRDQSRVRGRAWVSGNTQLRNSISISGDARINGNDCWTYRCYTEVQ